jgi:hypothetical protein
MADAADCAWHAADPAALGLNGSGAQDRDHEAILEIALVAPRRRTTRPRRRVHHAGQPGPDHPNGAVDLARAHQRRPP